MKITIGKAGKHEIKLDLDVLLSTRMLLTADSGGGKTFALKRIVEQASGKIQIFIVDPEGEFAPLREHFNFVLVGKGGETPADVRSAEKVGQTLLALGASAIFDIYEMKPTTRHEWVSAFLNGLIEAPKQHRHPCLVIVDEAHMFCPERGKGESVATEAMRDLCTRGRKRLLCPLFATQRLATLNKDASSMLLNRMIGPTFEDLNRKRAAEVLSITKEDQHEFNKQIQLLEPGNFFALGRAISRERVLVRVAEIKSAHGQEALKYELSPPPPPEKIKALLPKLADLPKQAEEQARTVAECKAEIRSLKAQLRSRPMQEVQPPATDQRAVERAAAATMRAFKGSMGQLQRRIAEQRAVLDKCAKLAAQELSRELPDVKADGAVEAVQVVHTNAPVIASARPAAMRGADSNSPKSDSDAPKLKAGAVKMLEILGQWNPDPRTRDQLGALSGFSPTGGTFSEYLSILRRNGYISENGNGLHITDEGLATLPQIPERPDSPEELIVLWKSKFKAGVGRMLDCLVEVYPHGISREELGEKSGFTASGGTFSEYLSMLRRARLIEEGGGQVAAAKSLMEV